MPKSGEIAPLVGGFGLWGVSRKHFRGELGGPEGDFIEVAVGGFKLLAFFALFSLAAFPFVTERREKQLPIVFLSRRKGVGVKNGGHGFWQR